MVEATGEAAVDVTVGLFDAGLLESIHPAGLVAQPAYRRFHRVGVEVAEHDDAVAAGVGRVGFQPRIQTLGRIQAQRIPAAGAVLLIGVQAGGFRAAFRLQMIGDHDEGLAAAAHERLRQRTAAAFAERAFQQRGGLAGGLHLVAAVDDADADGVRARALLGVDEAPGAATGIQGSDQLRQAGVGAVAIVLQLHQRGDVGIQAADGGDQLRHLCFQLLRRLGAALGGKAAAAAVAVE